MSCRAKPAENTKGRSGTIKAEECAVDDIEWAPTETEEPQVQSAPKGKKGKDKVVVLAGDSSANELDDGSGDALYVITLFDDVTNL
jgi:hypothetical protein